MNLQTIHDLAASRSYFSRPDSEVWAAINAGSRFAYQAVLKEDRQYFRTTDTSSVTIVPNTQEYALPVTVNQLIRVRERFNVQDKWRLIEPADTNSPEGRDDSPSPSVTFGCSSQFNYQGPYLPQSDAVDGNDDQTLRIFLTPIPQDTRLVELIYIAKYVEVFAATDPYMIPTDLRDFVLDFAISELLRGNNDDLAEKYEAAAGQKLDMALTVIRERQLQHPTTVTPYLSEYL